MWRTEGSKVSEGFFVVYSIYSIYNIILSVHYIKLLAKIFPSWGGGGGILDLPTIDNLIVP